MHEKQKQERVHPAYLYLLNKFSLWASGVRDLKIEGYFDVQHLLPLVMSTALPGSDLRRAAPPTSRRPRPRRTLHI